MMNLIRSPKMQWTALVTLGAFTSTVIGCTTPEGDVDTADREVTTELLASVADDTGATALRPVHESTIKLSEVKWPNRQLIVDGRATTKVTDVLGATEVVIPLNDGFQMNLRRNGNLFEIQGEVRPESSPGAHVRAFAVTREGDVQLFRSDNLDNAAPSVVLKVKGLDDLTEIRQALAVNLALQSMLANLEDGESVIPVAVVLAIVAAIMAGAWLAACYFSFRDCLNHCKNRNGADHKCGAAKVKVRGKNVDVDWTLGFGCKCY